MFTYLCKISDIGTSIKGATLINEQNMKFVRDLLMSYLGTKFWAILVHNIMKIIAFHSNGTLSACQA